AARLQRFERRVGGSRRDVPGGRLLGEVVVRELLDGPLEIAGAHAAELQGVGRQRRALGEIALALAGLQRHVPLPGETGGILESLGVTQRQSLAGHDVLRWPERYHPFVAVVRIPGMTTRARSGPFAGETAGFLACLTFACLASVRDVYF